MDIILIALAFVGGFTGIIIVGMIITMYFYSQDALGSGHSRAAHGLRTLTGRSVPVQVTTGTGARQSDINLGLSSDPGARYVRGSMIVTAMFLLLIFIAIILILSSSLPK